MSCVAALEGSVVTLAVAAGRRADQHVDRRLRSEERGERVAVADVALRERDPGDCLRAMGGRVSKRQPPPSYAPIYTRSEL